jgi:hypothetical protein
MFSTFRKSTTQKRRPGSHGHLPFSRATQHRVIADLTARALAGDVPAMEALLRLNYDYGPDGLPGGPPVAESEII